MVHIIETQETINAPASVVYNILTDFVSYKDWNPMMISASGEAKVGTTLFLQAKEMSFKPKVLVAEPGKEFRWIGRVLFPGIFDGEHYFLIQPQEGGGEQGQVKLVQGERFTGGLVGLFNALGQMEKTESRFKDVNAALKKRAETLASSTSEPVAATTATEA